MNLPLNGRIVIIDDQIKEAQPLINVLSKKRIPFNYYSGTRLTDFPDNSDDNKLRVLFLDLNIFELNKGPKDVISSIHGILSSIIPDNPNPYLLVVWSKQNNDYKVALEEHFQTHLQPKAPAQIIFLKKGDYFDYSVEDGWTPQAGCLEKIEKDLTREIQNISLLSNLIIWENIIHAESSKTISQFAAFYPIDKNWDKNSKAIIYRLAKSVVGTDEIGTCSDQVKLAKAFISLNSFLFDKIENEVEAFKLGNISGIPSNDGSANVSDDIKSKINSVLHISQKGFTINNFDQGNIYIIPNEDSLVEKIIWDKKFKEAMRNEILSEPPILIQLDITPVCDYSQDKKYVRVIYGLIIQPKYFDSCKSQYFYTTPVIHFQNENKFLLFDFRYIKTLSKDLVTQRNIVPSLKLRREICTDIQSQLANQINRPGISNV